ncbi:ABC transporter ATP-binding protein [Actinopolymorpha sp. B17G11]|uniref:ABC transporter ATP-binding protein n=1 Tax=Actinopolymorpha sp. B17G11 TaxID=3160861 RepID=UPI0032E412CD
MNAWLRTGRLLFGIAWEIGPVVVFSFIGVRVIGAVSPLLLALGLRPLVDGITSSRTDQILGGAAVCAVGLTLTALAPTFYRWTTIRQRERAIMVMQRRVLTLAGGAPRVEHVEVPAFWDRLRLLERSTEDLATGMTLAVIGPILLAELAVSAILLGRLQPVLLLVPVIALPAAWLSRRAEALRRAADLRTAEGRRAAEHLLTLASTAGPATEVRVYGLHHELLDRHRQVSRDVHRGMETGHFLAVAVNAGGWLLFAVTYVGALLLVLREAAGGRATAGDVALTLGLAAAVVLAAGRLSDLAGSLLRTRTASEHYHWLEGQASPSLTGGEPEPPPTQLRAGIDLDRVSFRYPGSDRSVLSDVSLRLPAGGVVAVVGENGAGKTTLVKLLCGMYAPTEGRILLDDIDLADIDIEAYRKRLTAGFQDFMRFELAIREAVGVGDLPRMDDEDAVRGALAKANAGFTERLPGGVETQLGLSWQGGVDLSGGEWQKLALARSMLRSDPLLMVLDEPTAALDPHTEHALFEQVAAGARDARSGRVTLLISHRFSTVRMADLIVVLDQGRVVEQGSHEDLVGQDGLYAELYHLQAKAYQQS